MARTHALLATVALMAATLVCADIEVGTSYQTILRTSQKLPNRNPMFGQVFTHDSRPVYESDKDGKKTDKLLVSNEPDFTSILEVEKAGMKKLFLVTHFESPRPATQYVVELRQAKNGTLTPMDMRFVDWSHLHGLWIPCAGSRTPWMTHLGSEEYEPDARPFSEATDLATLKDSHKSWGDIEQFMRYFGLYPSQLTFKNVMANFNPYRYGHITETTVQFDGTAQVRKYYTLGRAAWEMAIVMPDQRTVYAAEDGTNNGFIKFVADRPGDLTSGRLFAARMTQTKATGGGAFRVNWIHLGHGQNDDLIDLAETTTFADIFETAEFNKGCPAGFKSINAGGVGPECLKLKPGMATAAAFLETRRYAAMKGATTEFSKWEGLSYDPKRNHLYTAMSAIRRGMENKADKGEPSTKHDAGGPNHVRLPYNKCGCIYTLKLDKMFNVYSMAALVCGKPNPDKTDEANTCALDAIASPDNVAFIPELDTLLIAEDTEYHENDVMWSYDMKTGRLERLLTTPYGAEVTSSYFYSNVNGFSYIVALSQHPYEAPFDVKLSEPESSGWDATIGYFTWPTSVMKGAVSADFEGIDYSKTVKEKHSMRGMDKLTIITKKPKRTLLTMNQ